jgi:hypothetical protein
MRVSWASRLTSRDNYVMNPARSSSPVCHIAMMLLVGAAVVSPPRLQGQDSSAIASVDQGHRPWLEGLTLNSFLSFRYTYNLNAPDSRKNQFRVFDLEDNTFIVDVLELALEKAAVKQGDIGFCCHLTAGSSVPKVARSSGLDIGDLDFHQMYVRYIVPCQHGITLDFGKFVTPCGLEIIEGYDGYNDNASRSFLFGYAIPYTHTGVRAAYTFSDRLAMTLMVVNGWDNSIDNNTSKTLGGQLALTPLAGLKIYANFVYGPEQSENNSNHRILADFVISHSIADKWTAGLNLDYGTERNPTPSCDEARWDGFAAYLRFDMLPQFSLSMRAEQFGDHQGVRTGVTQTLTETTLTPEYRISKNLVFRGELRIDWSDKDVFQKGAIDTNTQTTLLFNTLFVF